MQDLDEYDKKLLRLLQQNNKTTADELGIMVCLSTSAVQRRLKRLRNDKIIEADISIVSDLAAGIGITCIVDVILEDGSSKAVEKFKIAMKKVDEVMQCYCVTGTYDFVIIVNACDMKHYEEFAKKYLTDDSNVRYFHTHVAMDKVKTGYRVRI